MNYAREEERRRKRIYTITIFPYFLLLLLCFFFAVTISFPCASSAQSAFAPARGTLQKVPGKHSLLRSSAKRGYFPRGETLLDSSFIEQCARFMHKCIFSSVPREGVKASPMYNLWLIFVVKALAFRALINKFRPPMTRGMYSEKNFFPGKKNSVTSPK